jgi:hypothetical protein
MKMMIYLKKKKLRPKRQRRSKVSRLIVVLKSSFSNQMVRIQNGRTLASLVASS